MNIHPNRLSNNEVILSIGRYVRQLYKAKAKAFWGEYQRVILEQCPLIYIVCARGFFALNIRWDQRNV